MRFIVLPLRRRSIKLPTKNLRNSQTATPTTRQKSMFLSTKDWRSSSRASLRNGQKGRQSVQPLPKWIGHRECSKQTLRTTVALRDSVLGAVVGLSRKLRRRCSNQGPLGRVQSPRWDRKLRLQVLFARYIFVKTLQQALCQRHILRAVLQQPHILQLYILRFRQLLRPQPLQLNLSVSPYRSSPTCVRPCRTPPAMSREPRRI